MDQHDTSAQRLLRIHTEMSLGIHARKLFYPLRCKIPLEKPEKTGISDFTGEFI
jgi:hypothetical protein